MGKFQKYSCTRESIENNCLKNQVPLNYYSEENRKKEFKHLVHYWTATVTYIFINFVLFD